MTQFLAYAEVIFDENTSLETKLTTSNDSEIKYTKEVDLKSPDERKQKTKCFPCFPEFNTVDVWNFTNIKKNKKRPVC